MPTMKTSLCEETLGRVNPSVKNVTYDRSEVAIGIVHFGPGAFHRAHQAVYTDDLLRLQAGDWGICEVSINSATFRDAVQEQDNLYTLTVLDQQISQQIVGAIKEVLVAPEDPAAVIARLADPQTRVVTLTVTEKGYCLTPDGDLDFTLPGIEYDLNNPKCPRTVIGYLVAGLRERYKIDLEPFVVISCDNLTDNGHRLARAVRQFSATIDSTFGEWVMDKVHFPCTMVDSITPATDQAVKESVAEAIGVTDNWPVQREQFTQWVIEDIPNVELPPWNQVGAIFSSDVAGYEVSKLRILNGMHSSLAFTGLLCGFKTVEEAIKVDYLRAYIISLCNSEIIPTIRPVVGLDLEVYSADILQRFENPAIRHFLSQIAWDSTQKIPFRILGTISDNLNAGRDCAGLCLAIAAWMHMIRNMACNNRPITDPLSERLVEIGRTTGLTDSEFVDSFLAIEEMFPRKLVDEKLFMDNVVRHYAALGEDPRVALQQG